MIGKEKCRILKEIRQKIADENDIAYVTRECTHQGDCRGTCPQCESELRYLEKQLAARAAAGKRIAIAALCAGMTFSLSSCANLPDNKGKETVEELGGAAEPMPEPDEDVVLDGEVGSDYYDEDELEGAVADELEIDVTYTEDEGDTGENAASEGTEVNSLADSIEENAADEDIAETAVVEEETK